MTTKERLFIHYYLTEANYNGTKACIMAGYSRKYADRQAYKLLHKVEINRAIQEKLKELELTDTTIRQRLGQIATSGKKESNQVRALEVLAKIQGLLKDTNTQQVSIFSGIKEDLPQLNRESVTKQEATGGIKEDLPDL